MHIFEAITPTNRIEVVPGQSIQAALDAATPGTAILLKPGEYRENIRLPISGTTTAPIWIKSAGAPQTARIVCADREKTVIGGFGVDNWIIEGLEIVDGRYGIQFNDQNGVNCHNIAIVGNLIRDCLSSGDGDGMKVSHTDNAWIIGNTILDVQEEGIDVLASNDVIVAYNEINGARSTAGGMFCKGGSQRVVIRHNLIRNCYADGMTIGGQTGEQYFRPEARSADNMPIFEAKDCIAHDNYIIGVGQNTINFKGAVNCQARRNYCHGRNMISGTVNILLMYGGGPGCPQIHSHGNIVAENILRMNSQIKIASGSTGNTVQTDRPVEIYAVDAWPTKVGPAAIGLAPRSTDLDALYTQIAALKSGASELQAALDAAWTKRAEAEAVVRLIAAAHTAVESYQSAGSLT